MAVFLSEEERSLVKSYLLLVYIQKKFDHDTRALEESDQLSAPGLYREVIRSAADRANLLLSEVRRDLRKQNLRLYEVDQSDSSVEAQILCKGHHGTFQIPAVEFRQEAAERMRAYLGLIPATEASSAPADDRQPAPYNPSRVREPARYSGYSPYRTGT
ncbi:hypothetical protein [Paenibacillus sp. Z6-24]